MCGKNDGGNAGAGLCPEVSVVVPFFNVLSCVDDCMRSLLAQDFDSYEIVCVDDGSTDGLVAMASPRLFHALTVTKPTVGFVTVARILRSALVQDSHRSAQWL